MEERNVSVEGSVRLAQSLMQLVELDLCLRGRWIIQYKQLTELLLREVPNKQHKIYHWIYS